MMASKKQLQAVAGARRHSGLFLKGRHLCLPLLALLLLLCAGLAFAADEIERANELHKKVIELYKQRNYIETIPLAEELLFLSKKYSGSEHIVVAVVMKILGWSYFNVQEYAKTESMFEVHLSGLQSNKTL